MSYRDADLYSLMEAYPPNSPYWSLVDAFDAAANGMENPESFSRMEAVSDPQFQPWKALIRAIRALYAGNTRECLSSAESIDDAYAPALLKPLFRAWISRQGTANRENVFEELSDCRDSVAELYRRLLIEPHTLSLLAAQAEEALHHDLREQFCTLAIRIIKKLQEERRCDGPLLALRYARYCLEALNRAGYDGSDFFPLIIRTLGEGDGFCVLGFALIGKDNEAAAAALGKALGAGDGLFLDTATAELVAQVRALLLESAAPEPKKRKARKTRTPQRARHTKAPLQLELFDETNSGGTDGYQ
jgi:hypothetical protein